MRTALDAQASVNLPLPHWAYEAIDRLTVLGVIEHAMVVTEPSSRKQAANYAKGNTWGMRNGRGEAGAVGVSPGWSSLRGGLPALVEYRLSLTGRGVVGGLSS
ncbi:MAG: hypothetical protein C4293_07945, partial [Nitrospiraceae bacterium]